MPLALVVDDDAELRAALADICRLEGFDTAEAGSLAEARAALARRTPDVVLTDLVLPDGSGTDLVPAATDAPRPEIVLVTGHASVESAIAAIRIGALDYLVKPLDVQRLKSILAKVTPARARKAEIASLRGASKQDGRFGPLIGSSPAMQHVYDLIARVAPTSATVLVTGESGTGKELVAHTVHELSPRRERPFVAANCGAFPANLIESALFGHERGSFTGATQQRRGLFEQADGGTLFLDEITEMPVELQPKLLRVLETGRLTRIGGEGEFPVDVRVVAATNRAPADAVQKGRLREDLYYRLNVFPIEMPPLRARGDDVARLAQHFLDAVGRGAGEPYRFGADARAAFRSHSWPGNVRELKNWVERCAILGRDVVEFGRTATPASGPAAAGGAFTNLRVGMTLDEIERVVILATLEHCEGDKRRAAETLGISLKTLYNRLNEYEARSSSSPD